MTDPEKPLTVAEWRMIREAVKEHYKWSMEQGNEFQLLLAKCDARVAGAKEGRVIP